MEKVFQKMHPSDVRSLSWGSVIYTVGSDTENEFPAYSYDCIELEELIQARSSAYRPFEEDGVLAMVAIG